jgi:uncharacterized protein YndB with AHSA1/START domain
VRWCAASDTWHAPHSENDLVTGGAFFTRMEAKDGSMGFDFRGVYIEVEQHKKIAYALEDGRRVYITFEAEDGQTNIVEEFEPESAHTHEQQQQGWQGILDNFKRFSEQEYS